MVYDEDTGFLYSGDKNGGLCKYKVDSSKKTFERVKEYGYLGIGEISSFHPFMHFVFFGGDNTQIKVLDLSTDELLLGHLETSITWICSLQVCLKSQDKIYLAVSGSDTDYSDDKNDLFDLTDILPKDPVIIQKYF